MSKKALWIQSLIFLFFIGLFFVLNLVLPDKDFSQQAFPEDFDYDVAFIGTAHSSRPRIVKTLTAQCKQRGRKFYSYLFTPHYLVYFYNKLLIST